MNTKPSPSACTARARIFTPSKAWLESLLKAVVLPSLNIVPVKDDPTFHPGRCARLSVGGEDLGVIGEIHPAVCETYGISAKVYVANLYFDVLFNHHLTQKQYKPLPKHPAVTRDLALLCDASQPVHELEKAIQKAAGKLLEEIVLFDVYQGKQIEEGKKSVAYSIVLRAEDRTLNDQDVEHVMNKILKALESMQVTLRS